MAVIVKYVVVWNGKEDMVFATKQEAEAHDKMLAIAERLYTFLENHGAQTCRRHSRGLNYLYGP